MNYKYILILPSYMLFLSKIWLWVIYLVRQMYMYFYSIYRMILVSCSCFNFLYLYYYFRAFRANSDVWTLLYPYVLYPFTHIAMGGTIFMTMAISIGKKNCPQNIGTVHSLLIFFPLFYRTVFGTMSPIVKPA